MADSAPFFSVCIPVYNGEKFIRTAIDSVLAQTCTDWELVIVDDVSTDRTWEVLQEYRGHPQIKLHKNTQNLGQGANFNRCLDHARGRWMGLLAADDAYAPHALETIRRGITEHPDLLLWVHAHCCHALNGPLQDICGAFPQHRKFGAMEFAELLYTRGGIFGEISNFFFNLDAYRQSPSFRFTENFIHIDGHFWMQLMFSHPDGSAFYSTEVLTDVLVHEQSLSSQNSRANAGNDVLVLYQATELSASLGWRTRIQLHQIARILWIGIRFFPSMPAHLKFRAWQTIRLLGQRIVGQ